MDAAARDLFQRVLIAEAVGVTRTCTGPCGRVWHGVPPEARPFVCPDCRPRQRLTDDERDAEGDALADLMAWMRWA